MSCRYGVELISKYSAIGSMTRFGLKYFISGVIDGAINC